MRYIVALIVLASWGVGPSAALEPQDVFLIVNKNEPKSRQVADHYCKLRKVPEVNIVELDLPTVEDISREDYNNKLVKPLREVLQTRKSQVKVLLTILGVPLRVGPQMPTEEETKLLAG